MGRPAKKKAYWEAKKAEAGRLQAQREYYKKTPLTEILKDKVLNAVDRINPLEFAAVMAITPLVHQTIMLAPELQTKVLPLLSPAYATYLYGTEVVTGIWAGMMGALKVTAETEGVKTYAPTTTTTEPVKPANPLDSPMSWILAFGIAYILIHNAGQIFGLLDKGLTAVIGALLA